MPSALKSRAVTDARPPVEAQSSFVASLDAQDVPSALSTLTLVPPQALPPAISSIKRSLEDARARMRAGEIDEQDCKRRLASIVEDFWDITARQTPIIVPDPEDDRYALVTFLWRGDKAHAVLFLAVAPDEADEIVELSADGFDGPEGPPADVAAGTTDAAKTVEPSDDAASVERPPAAAPAAALAVATPDTPPADDDSTVPADAPPPLPAFLLAGFMKRLVGTDIWHISYRVAADWHAAYCFFARTYKGGIPRVSGSGDEQDQAAVRKVLLCGAPDPRNPRVCQSAVGGRLSVVRLSDASRFRLSAAARLAGRGSVTAHEPVGEGGYTVWVYEPPVAPFRDMDALVMFDGDAWVHTGRINETLDKLIGEGRIPPMYALLIDATDERLAASWEESGEPLGIESFIADGLLPWARRRWPITKDPAHLIIAGQGLGATTALWTAIKRPECFQNIILQSASLDHEHFMARLAGSKSLLRGFGARTYLEVGRREGTLWTLNRDLGKMLNHLGLDHRYVAYSGQGGWVNRRSGVSDGLCWVAGAWECRAAASDEYSTAAPPPKEARRPVHGTRRKRPYGKEHQPMHPGKTQTVALTPPKVAPPAPAPRVKTTVTAPLKSAIRKIRATFRQRVRETAGEGWPANAYRQRLLIAACDPAEQQRLIGEAVADFWATTGARTPIIVPDPQSRRHAFVTFLWRDDKANAVLLFANRITDERNLKASLMERVKHTDVWHITYRMETDWRASYCFIPAYDRKSLADITGVHKASIRKALDRGLADPRNPLTCKNHAGNTLSVAELKDASPQPWLAPRPDVPCGNVTIHKLIDGHTVWAYEPPAACKRQQPKGVDRDRDVDMDEDAGVLIMFDGDMWMRTEHMNETLDNLIAAGEIPPIYALLVETDDIAARWDELSEDSGVEGFVADELLSWARRRWPITDDASRTIIAGQSLGALSALWVAARRPESVGNVIAQSASLWRGSLMERTDDGKATHMEGFTGHIYLECGKQEWVLLPLHRKFARMLRKGGQQQHLNYVEYNGGHDYACWRGGIADGLRWVTKGWSQFASNNLRDSGTR